MGSNTDGVPPDLRGNIGDESDEDIIMGSQDNQIRKRKKQLEENEQNKKKPADSNTKIAVEALLTMGTTIPVQAQPQLPQDTQVGTQPSTEDKNKNEQRFWRPPIITEFPKEISGPFKIIVQPEKINNSPTSRLFAIDVAKHLIPK